MGHSGAAVSHCPAHANIKTSNPSIFTLGDRGNPWEAVSQIATRKGFTNSDCKGPFSIVRDTRILIKIILSSVILMLSLILFSSSGSSSLKILPARRYAYGTGDVTGKRLPRPREGLTIHSRPIRYVLTHLERCCRTVSISNMWVANPT